MNEPTMLTAAKVAEEYESYCHHELLHRVFTDLTQAAMLFAASADDLDEFGARCVCGMWPRSEYGERCPSCPDDLVARALRRYPFDWRCDP